MNGTSTIDLIVIGVIAISAIIAFLRGFVREMLTIGSWIGAALVTLYAFPALQSRFEALDSSSKLAAAYRRGAGPVHRQSGCFLAHQSFRRKADPRQRLDFVDRSLGLLFGLVRGVSSLVSPCLYDHRLAGPKPRARGQDASR